MPQVGTQARIDNFVSGALFFSYINENCGDNFGMTSQYEI
jgi:hypothetical protein